MLDWNTYRECIEEDYWNRDIPDWLGSAPSMTHPNEKSMYWHLIRDYPGTIERIVDAGCFSGGSTLAFCRGLKDSDRPLKPNMIASYDLFETDIHSQKVFARFGVDLPVGGSYLDTFLDVIREHRDLVSVVKGNIMDFGWRGGPIDILFLDVLKKSEINDHCVREFFPSLKVDSLVLQQDFYHNPLPWIPLTMALLDDHFEPLRHCRSTMAFRCTAEISRDKADEVISLLATMPVEEKAQIFDRIIEAAPSRPPRANMMLSKIWMHRFAGRPVRDMLDELPAEIAELDWVQWKIKRMGSTADSQPFEPVEMVDVGVS